MSHEVESMFYVREVPWHGIGVKLPAEVNSEEAIKHAGLDWEVTLEDVMVCGQVVQDRKATVRSTDKFPLGIVGTRYRPVQNRDAFKFFDTVVGKKEAMYHTAGSLRHGRCIWLLAKLPDTYEVKKVDKVENYLLFTNSHDGWNQLRMLWTPVRVVCNNTLNIALQGNHEGFHTRHTEKVMDRALDAVKLLGLTKQRFANFMSEAERIADQAFTVADLEKFVADLFEMQEEKVLAEQHATKREAAMKVKELVEVGTGMDNVATKGTKWGLFNAVTEFVDHDREVRAKAGALDSAWFGSGARLKQRAWDLLTTSSVN